LLIFLIKKAELDRRIALETTTTTGTIATAQQQQQQGTLNRGTVG
jgi:hypothetical protein